ncbi:hypothetical protein D3C77_330850 [compost metagenome]
MILAQYPAQHAFVHATDPQDLQCGFIAELRIQMTQASKQSHALPFLRLVKIMQPGACTIMLHQGFVALRLLKGLEPVLISGLCMLDRIGLAFKREPGFPFMVIQAELIWFEPGRQHDVMCERLQVRPPQAVLAVG